MVTSFRGVRIEMRALTLTAITGLPGAEGSNDEIYRAVLALLPVEFQEEIRSDDQTARAFYNRLASAKSKLGKAGQLTSPSKGRWSLGVAGGEAAGAAIRAPRARRAGRLIEAWKQLPAPSRSAGFDLPAIPTSDLVALYPKVLGELKRRKIIRTANLVGEYGERLVAEAFNGRLAPASQRGWDVTVGSQRLQVKARMVTNPANNGQLQLGTLRVNLGDNVRDSFEELCVVLFDQHLQVGRAIRLPAEAAADFLGPLVPRVNGHTIFATDAVMFHHHAQDITDDLRVAAEKLDALSEWPTTIELSRPPIG